MPPLELSEVTQFVEQNKILENFTSAGQTIWRRLNFARFSNAKIPIYSKPSTFLLRTNWLRLSLARIFLHKKNQFLGIF